jgi:hypothetical protein
MDSAKGDAFALVVADNLVQRGAGSYTFLFSRVDLSSSTFTSEWFSIIFDAGAGTFVVDEMKKPTSMNTTLRFGGKVVPSGDYAYVARKDLKGNVEVENCFSEGAPVFRIAANKVNIIPLDALRGPGATDPNIAMTQSAMVLTGYPKLNAPQEIAQQVASITFETAKVLGREVCRKRDVKNFIITPQSR